MFEGVLAAVALAAPLCMTAVFAASASGQRVASRWARALMPLSQVVLVGYLLAFMLAAHASQALFCAVAVAGLLCAVCDVALLRGLRMAEERDVAAHRARLLDDQVRMQARRYDRLVEDARAAKAMSARMAEELDAVDAALASGNRNVAPLLAQAAAALAPGQARFCENEVVDALVSSKAHACDQAGIKAEFALDVPAEAGIAGVDLCALFANVIDNAINACERVAQPNRFIRLRAVRAAGMFALEMENSCEAGAGKDAGGKRRRFGARAASRAAGHAADAESRTSAHAESRTSAHAESRTSAPTAGPVPHVTGAEGESNPAPSLPDLDGHGWGMLIVEDIAKRYDGSFATEREGGVFCTTVTLRMQAQR